MSEKKKVTFADILKLVSLGLYSYSDLMKQLRLMHTNSEPPTLSEDEYFTILDLEKKYSDYQAMIKGKVLPTEQSESSAKLSTLSAGPSSLGPSSPSSLAGPGPSDTGWSQVGALSQDASSSRANPIFCDEQLSCAEHSSQAGPSSIVEPSSMAGHSSLTWPPPLVGTLSQAGSSSLVEPISSAGPASEAGSSYAAEPISLAGPSSQIGLSTQASPSFKAWLSSRLGPPIPARLSLAGTSGKAQRSRTAETSQRVEPYSLPGPSRNLPQKAPRRPPYPSYDSEDSD